MALPVSKTSARGPSGWGTVGEAWVLSGGQWQRVASAKVVSGGNWVETYSSTPTLTSLTFSSTVTDFTTLSVSWTLGPTANRAVVALYSYTTNLDGTPDLASKAQVGGTPVHPEFLTTTSASWSISQDTYYSVEVTPYYLRPGATVSTVTNFYDTSDYVAGSTTTIKRRIGHPQQTTTYPIYGWDSNVTTTTSLSALNWTANDYIRASLSGYGPGKAIDGSTANPNMWLSAETATDQESGETTGGATPSTIIRGPNNKSGGVYLTAPDDFLGKVESLRLTHNGRAWALHFPNVYSNLLYHGLARWRIRYFSGTHQTNGNNSGSQTGLPVEADVALKSFNEMLSHALTNPYPDGTPWYVTSSGGGSPASLESSLVLSKTVDVGYSGTQPIFGVNSGFTRNAKTIYVEQTRWASHWHAGTEWRADIAEVNLNYYKWIQTGTGTTVLVSQVSNSSW